MVIQIFVDVKILFGSVDGNLSHYSTLKLLEILSRVNLKKLETRVFLTQKSSKKFKTKKKIKM